MIAFLPRCFIFEGITWVLPFVQVEMRLSNFEFEISSRLQTGSQLVKTLSCCFIHQGIIRYKEAQKRTASVFMWGVRAPTVGPWRRSACLSVSLAFLCPHVSCTSIFWERNELLFNCFRVLVVLSF